MDLRLVSGKPFGCNCVKCGVRLNHPEDAIMADIDGKAFEAFYCMPCVVLSLVEDGEKYETRMAV